MAKKTNMLLVQEIIDKSSYGSLASAFVIQALDYYAKIVKNASDIQTGGLINPEAWRGIAVEVLDKLDKYSY